MARASRRPRPVVLTTVVESFMPDRRLGTRVKYVMMRLVLRLVAAAHWRHRSPARNATDDFMRALLRVGDPVPGLPAGADSSGVAVLRGVLDCGGPAVDVLLRAAGQSRIALARALADELGRRAPYNLPAPAPQREARRALDAASRAARARGVRPAGAEFLILGLARAGGAAASFLDTQGLSVQVLEDALSRPPRPSAQSTES